MELVFVVNSHLYNGAPGPPISIQVRAPNGTSYTSLVNKNETSTSLNSILVSSQPFHTGALCDTANSLYPPGIYTVHAECNLNGMKDNYKSGGADYVGKTVSPSYTISLTSGSSAPAASFTSNVTSGTVPFAVHFTDTSTGSPVNWTWNFGDGNHSAAQNPVHTFVQPQVFTVSLTVTNATGQ